MTKQERLKLLRDIKGLSQQDFAQIFEKSLGTIQSWEQGRINAPDKALKKIAEYFGISQEWLIYGTGEMEISAHNSQVVTGSHNITVRDGNVSTGNSQTLDPETSEICELLTRYASPEFKKNLRERLLKMKADSQI